MRPPPPRLPRTLVGLVVSAEDRAYILADLDERYWQIVETRGRSAARRWYWWQALRVAPLLRDVRDPGRVAPWDGVAAELRQSLRSLLRRPLYTLGVAGTLGLGLASASTVGVVAWRVWLSPLPFPDPDRLVRIYELQTEGDRGNAGPRRWRLSPPLVHDMQRHTWRTLSDVASVSTINYDWSGADGVSRLSGLTVSPALFRILGLPPAVGRTLTDDETLAEAVLSEAFWVRAFGGDPSVVGREIVLDAVPHRVVGVVRLPAGYPPAADVVTAAHVEEDQLREGMRGARYLDVVARVRPGFSARDAAAEVDAFVSSLGETQPQHAGWGGEAVVLAEDLMGPYQGVLTLLMAAGVAFLILAAVNVAGLVASRRVEGQGETAVRRALGASGGRLLRQWAIESLLIGTLGGLLGLVGAYWLLAPVRRLVPQNVPRAEDVGLDPAAGAWIVLAGIVIGAVVGTLGHVTARSSSDTRRLVGAGRGGTVPLRGRRLLVVGQVALSTLLVTGGTVTLKDILLLRSVETGFRAEGVQATPLVLGQGAYPTPEAALTFWRQLLEGLEARGLEAAVGVNPPMAGSNMNFGFRTDAAAEEGHGQYHSVSRGYFSALGIEVIEGRAFTDADHESSAPVVIISEALAREHFPEGSAVGQELQVVATPRTVVGVVASTRHFGPGQGPPPELYVPLGQDPWTLSHVLLKTTRDDAAVTLAAVVEGIDPDVAVAPPHPYARFLSDWYAPLRMRLVIVGTLALVGMALAGLGIYALVAYHVSMRRREIGIRMALGAPDGTVFRGVVGQGSAMALAGVTFGLAAWYAVLPAIRERVETVSPTGLAVPAVVAAVVVGVAIVATVVPARRSTTIDPAVSLEVQ